MAVRPSGVRRQGPAGRSRSGCFRTSQGQYSTQRASREEVLKNWLTVLGARKRRGPPHGGGPLRFKLPNGWPSERRGTAAALFLVQLEDGHKCLCRKLHGSQGAQFLLARPPANRFAGGLQGRLKCSGGSEFRPARFSAALRIYGAQRRPAVRGPRKSRRKCLFIPRPA